MSTTSATNAKRCDLHLFARESDARAAVARIGGDTSVAEPTPIKQLHGVDVADIRSLTPEWRQPPWEPPTFRELQFRPLRLSALTNGAVGSDESIRRITMHSPKEERESFWKTWIRVARHKRDHRDAPWLEGSDSNSSTRLAGSDHESDRPWPNSGRRSGQTRSARRWIDVARKRISPPPRLHASARD